MTQLELQSQVRELVGRPDLGQVPPEHIDSCLNRAIQWLSVKLKTNIIEDEQSMPLTAGQIEYPIPTSVCWFIAARWNKLKLTPSSLFAWDRDNRDWKNSPPGTPQEWAVLGRTLFMYPSPTAANVTTDPFLHYHAVTSAPKLGAGGPVGMSDLDMQVLVYRAAWDWLSQHPSETNNAMKADYVAAIQDLLPDAEGRANNPQLEYNPRVHPEVLRYRAGR